MGAVRNQIVIHAAQQQVWDALTRPEFTRSYFFGTEIQISPEKGAAVQYLMSDGSVAVDGEVIEWDPPGRLTISWHVNYDAKMAEEPASLVTFTIESQGTDSQLTILHDHFPQNSRVPAEVDEGWKAVMFGLKALLEGGTGTE
ncbi:MAG: hypothetical protein QOH04_3105 [Sphingomonadales bacterium]|jgi:uncharacterized protein YndB with AHSA1/START domain|nr:hypothetical protein [Sphingomonadales bacterium]